MFPPSAANCGARGIPDPPRLLGDTCAPLLCGGQGAIPINRLRNNVYYEFWSGLAAARLAVIEPMHRDDLLTFLRASWRALAKMAVPGNPATEIAAGEAVFIADVERRAGQIARDIAAAQGVSRVVH